jgi:hypothetical protein
MHYAASMPNVAKEMARELASVCQTISAILIKDVDVNANETTTVTPISLALTSRLIELNFPKNKIFSIIFKSIFKVLRSMPTWNLRGQCLLFCNKSRAKLPMP